MQVAVGDMVELVPNVVNFDDALMPMKVVKVSKARFTCDIGFNQHLGCRMYQDYRKSDGRSVGNRKHTTFVRLRPQSAKGTAK